MTSFKKHKPHKHRHSNKFERYPEQHPSCHDRNWDKWTEDQKLQDMRFQLWMSIGRISEMPERADCKQELRQLSYFLWTPINNSKELELREKKHYSKFFLDWVERCPHTKQMAINKLASKIAKIDRILNKKKLQQANEFLYQMGIRRVELEPTAKELFEQIFGDDGEEALA